VMEAVESSAGLVGPALGGILFRMGPNVPLVTVVLIYTAVFFAIFLYYRDTIVHHKKRKSTVSPIVGGNGGEKVNALNEKKVKVENKKTK
jgi:hypothetical protein